MTNQKLLCEDGREWMVQARRQCAEQDTPGRQNGKRNRRKRVAAMVKNVFFRMTGSHFAALTILGWLAFVLGLIANPIGLKLVLLSAGRVLP